MLAVDNLPCELPKDSSTFFSNELRKFMPIILNADYNKPLTESGLSPEIQKAVIVYNGELTPSYKYLHQHISSLEIHKYQKNFKIYLILKTPS